LKIVSLFLSVFIWIYVLNSEKIKFEKTVELDYILPVDMMFADNPPREVTFSIEGPRAFVRTVMERSDRMIIDLNKTNTKRQLKFSFDVHSTQLDLPIGMKVERIQPRKLQVALEKKVSKIVPLKLQFQGELPENLFIQKSFVDPQEVEVYGPRSAVLKLKEISTKPIELDSLEGRDQISVEAQVPDERLSITGKVDIKFYFQIKASRSNLTLEQVPIRFISENSRVSSPTRSARVKVFVGDKVMKNRSNVSSSIQVWADVPSDARGKMVVPLKVIVPPSVHLVEVTPKTIIVNVQ
jgi:YbbR domain-containing protein